MSLSKLWKDQDFTADSSEEWGRDRFYSEPQEMWTDAVLYFEWASSEEASVDEHKIFNSATGPSHTNIDHARPFTIREYCLYVGISQDTWQRYKKRPEYKDVTEAIKDIIYSQKFAGAAVNIYNMQIIARDLGLVERSDVTSGGKTIAKDFNAFYDPEAIAAFEKATGQDREPDEDEDNDTEDS